MSAACRRDLTSFTNVSLVRKEPSMNWNKGPASAPLRARYGSNAVRGHRGWLVFPSVMVTLCLKGLVLEALIVIKAFVGLSWESRAMSLRQRCQVGS